VVKGGNHNRLGALAGEWIGDEVVAPSPWDKRGGKAVSRTTARMALGGRALVTDYVEERNGKVILEGHGVYTWEARDVYRRWWFDTSGPGPDATLEGRWVGDTLTIERPALTAGKAGRVRYVYTVEPGGHAFVFRIEQATKTGEPWRTLMEGRYRRA
jgi:hypothetical protein